MTVLATGDEVTDIVHRLGVALCPEEDHRSPCANAWTINSALFDELDPPERKSWAADVEALMRQRADELKHHPPSLASDEATPAPTS